jgi:hypothetical protein
VLTRGSFVFLGFGNRSRWRIQSNELSGTKDEKLLNYTGAELPSS